MRSDLLSIEFDGCALHHKLPALSPLWNECRRQSFAGNARGSGSERNLLRKSKAVRRNISSKVFAALILFFYGSNHELQTEESKLCTVRTYFCAHHSEQSVQQHYAIRKRSEREGNATRTRLIMTHEWHSACLSRHVLSIIEVTCAYSSRCSQLARFGCSETHGGAARGRGTRESVSKQSTALIVMHPSDSRLREYQISFTLIFIVATLYRFVRFYLLHGLHAEVVYATIADFHSKT